MMTAPKQVSAFDIIGPIMVGPSSSHTAGAVRLGQIGRLILGCQPTEAQIELHGSFAQTGQGHGTDKAIVAGLLGLATYDERIRDSFMLAKTAGMQFHFEMVDLGDEAHPNTVHLTLQSDERQVQVTGASVGGGMIQITNIQGYSTRFSGEYETLMVMVKDRCGNRPGTINAVTSWLLEHNINIAFFRVERHRRGGEAIMVIETDDPLPEEVVEAVQDFPRVRWVCRINKVSG
jgi:L-serine dehydratase